MNKERFEKLIQKITGRNLIIDTHDQEIINGKEYSVYNLLPVTQGKIRFKWKTATTDEKLLRSFITAFCTKYLEPNPKAYDKFYGGQEYKWEWMTDEQKENARFHHRSNMLSKDSLMKQIESNFNSPDMETSLIRYGFYPTEYGVGIFCFWETQAVVNAIKTMQKHLSELSIPFKNEFSDAKWVYRFKLGLNKESHTALLNNFAI